MMRSTAIGIIFISICMLCAQDNHRSVNEAVKLYESRHLNPENLLESEELLQKIIKIEPQNIQAYCELSYVYLLRGDNVASKDEKIKYYTQGQDYAKKAIAMDDNSAWAHLWYAANLGSIGETKGMMNSLFMLSEIKKEINKALAIDPSNTSALDARAEINMDVPSLFGGDLDKSMADLTKAVSISPNDGLLYLDLAKIYIKKKNYQKARDYLNKVIMIEKPVSEADQVLINKPEALKLLKKIENK